MTDSPTTIESRLERASDSSGYPVELLLAVYQSIPRTDERVLKLSSDTRVELQRILRFLRVGSTGDLATELASLKVRSFEDLAGAVKALESEGLVACPPDFYELLPSRISFHMTLSGLNDPISNRWSLTDIFTATTVIAVFLAGFSSSLPHGPYYTLAAGALILFGVWAILDAKNSETGKRTFVGSLIGILMSAAGFAIF